MSEQRDNETEDTGLDERVVRALRAPEILAMDFEARLMAQARAEIARRRATPVRRSWWVTGRVFVASPLATLAMAAGIAIMAAASTLVVARRPQATVTAGRDTVEFVRFVLVDSTARSVSVVGDFNGWKRDETPLIAAAKAGVWSVSLPLSPGRHEYAFIVDGERWVVDPASIASSDEFGTESSVLLVSPTRIGAL
jgi:AMP-activated protein kinase-like protein